MAKSYRLKKRDIKEYAQGTLFILPFMVLFAVFVVIPVFVSLYISFTDYDMLQTPKFVGIDNYRTLFLDDDIFQLSVKNTLLFAVISGPIGLFASFIMAWLINRMKFRNMYAIAFYAPSITSDIHGLALYIFSEPLRTGKQRAY